MFVNNVQAMLLQSERVSEMHFPPIWKTKFQKQNFSLVPAMKASHRDTELSKQQGN